jgi:hypothetical protein
MEALAFHSIFLAYTSTDMVFTTGWRMQFSLTPVLRFRYDRDFQIKMAGCVMREIYFPEKDKALRDDVRVLGALVGEMLAEQQSPEFLQLVETGFLRVQCDTCHAEHLIAFSCTNSRRFRRTQRLLSQLRGTSYGRKCCLAGG